MMLFYVVLFVMSAILVTGSPNHVHQHHHHHATPSDDMKTTTQKQAMTMKEQQAMVFNACLKKSGATIEEIKKLKQMDFENTSENAKCFTHCSLKMMKLVDKDGMLDFEMIHKMADQAAPAPATAAEMKRIVEVCRHEGKGEEGCEMAFRFIKCVGMHNKEFFMMLFN